MARKVSPSEVHARGFGDILGIVLIAMSVLLLVALFSYDPKDVAANTTDINQTPHNWIGQVGAWLAFAAYNLFGAGAYILPILLFCFGLSYLFQLMAYFHRRWLWAALLLFCCMGLLDLNHSASILARWQQHHNATSAGGRFGLMMNKYVFGHFGSVGATIIFATLYLISLLFLTNFQLGEWLRAFWQRQPAERPDDARSEDKDLERRAKELERQAKKLQEQVIKAGLGADLQPVPDPTVRDLSVPQAKPAFRSSTRPGKAKPAESEALEPPGVEGEVIPAREVAAATAQDILGQPKEKAKAPKDAKGEEAATAADGAETIAKGAVADEKSASEQAP